MELDEVPYQFLQEIKNDFAEDRQLGEGAYGAVYRGVTKNGNEVAVKILKDNSALDSQQFRDEFHHLRMLNNHPNIVQVLGYCYETKKTPTHYDGKTVLAEKTYKALCFEYLQNGTLRKHISGEFQGLDWHTRYNIIKGICYGLQYIHREQGDEHLYHLDLKPDNILLDKDMVPKIADFGTSKIFGKKVTLTTHPVGNELKWSTKCRVGTVGYQPPEHIERGEISEKFDIFSLGVVILEIMSGRNGRFKCAEIPDDEFIDLEKKNWRSRLQATWSGSSLEAYCNQVETCSKIALSCTRNDSHRRSSIKDIIDMLKESEIKVVKSTPLQVEPLQLQFPFEQENPMMACSLKLTNHTDDKVVFRLVTKNPKDFLCPLFGVVHSRHTHILDLTRHGKLLKAPVSEEGYLTLESIIVSDHEIGNPISYNVDSYNHFFEKGKKSGHEMHQVILTIVYRPPAEKATTKLPERDYNIVSTLSSTRIQDQHQNSNLIRSNRCNELEFVDIQEIPSDAGEEFIVGRIEEKKKIIDSLLVSIAEKTSVILPIYGIGGIGKTTFAKLIYNDFKHYSRVWVYVSPIFDFNMIRSSIISQLHEKDSETDERQGIHCCKNIMIVLDDLWEVKQFELDRLKDILHQGDSSNTVVLVTTRSKDVTERICVNHVPYEIESLTDNMCWDIIKLRSSFEARHDKVQLTGIGRAIAQKCGGVALAAKAVGFMLQFKGFDEWKQVRDNGIWNESISSENTPATNDVLASLKLSYENMVKSLKLCFSYCAIFSKGHKIVRDDLIYHWLSLGFIKATNLLSPRQRCENCIAQLLGLSFLQHSVAPTKSRTYAKGVTFFTMHDLVHDLARLVMGHGILDGSKQGNFAERSSRYALLTDCSKAFGSYTSYPEEIRALLFMHCGKIDLCGRAFLSAVSLRVLDLTGCSIGELPACVGELVQLRYLKAQNIESDMIPDCFSNLSKLIYLNMSGSGFSLLPKSIGALNCQIYLDISDCTLLLYLPESFQNLKSLAHLDVSNCWCLVETAASSFDRLTNLEYLNLSLEENHFSYLYKSRDRTWQGFFSSRVPKGLFNLTELRYLGLSNTMGGSLKNWGPSRTFSVLEEICALSNLERLDLSHNSAIVCVPNSICSLKKLHTLDLSDCTQLTGLPECIVKMDSLKVLNVTGCLELKKPTATPSQSNNITFLPHFKVCAQVDGSSSNISVLRHADPEELHISSLDNVKYAQEARSIELTHKQGMGSLTLEWTRGAERSVEDMELLTELVPPSNLMSFSMKGYNSASFPRWVMGIALHLPDLVKIELCDVTEIICLPPLGQLPNLQELVLEGLDRITTIGESFCGGASAFPQLTKFCLRRMENLEEWNTMYLCREDGVKKFMFPKLEELSIYYCLKLRMKPCPPRAKIWEIENGDHVLSSMRDGHAHGRGTAILTAFSSSSAASAAAAITQLRIIHCTEMTCLSPKFSMIKSLWLEDIAFDEIPKWLRNLITLQELVITRCTELRNLQHLSSLRLLSLKECPSIAALPEWPGSCLQELVISDCRGIKSLPKSILTNLNRLYIYYCCPELEQWCKENMMQLKHIKDKIMLDNGSPCCRFSLFADEQRALENPGGGWFDCSISDLENQQPTSPGGGWFD